MIVVDLPCSQGICGHVGFARDVPGDSRVADGAVIRPAGTFTRQVFLGDTLDPDSIVADYSADILTLTIPVCEQAKPRSIQVSTSDSRQPVTAG